MRGGVSRTCSDARDPTTASGARRSRCARVARNPRLFFGRLLRSIPVDRVCSRRSTFRLAPRPSRTLPRSVRTSRRSASPNTFREWPLRSSAATAPSTSPGSASPTNRVEPSPATRRSSSARPANRSPRSPVMQLVEAGRIDLDAPVQRYLPWFRVADENGVGDHHRASAAESDERFFDRVGPRHANGFLERRRRARESRERPARCRADGAGRHDRISTATATIRRSA